MTSWIVLSLGNSHRRCFEFNDFDRPSSFLCNKEKSYYLDRWSIKKVVRQKSFYLQGNSAIYFFLENCCGMLGMLKHLKNI